MECNMVYAFGHVWQAMYTNVERKDKFAIEGGHLGIKICGFLSRCYNLFLNRSDGLFWLQQCHRSLSRG